MGDYWEAADVVDEFSNTALDVLRYYNGFDRLGQW